VSGSFLSSVGRKVHGPPAREELAAVAGVEASAADELGHEGGAGHEVAREQRQRERPLVSPVTTNAGAAR
jgi:hypothetical protein